MNDTQGNIQIDISRCKGCGLCIVYCPGKCLKLSEKHNSAGHHYLELTEPEKCSFCGTCYIMCPDYAITVERNEKK